MDRYFQYAERHNCDAFVADYTELTKQDKIKRGVEIMREKPKDIDAFHLSNPHAHPYWAINFEQHKSYFDGKPNCECMFTAIHNKNEVKRWALLVELKYCKAKKQNMKRNAKKAWKQLLSTHIILKDKGCIDKSYNVFLNISMPPHAHHAPFTSFLSEAEIKKMKDKYNVISLGYNQIIIATPTFLKIPREEV